TGPADQILPWSELVNRPAEVAASQRLGAISIPLTRAVRMLRTAVCAITLRGLPLAVIMRGVPFSVTTVLLGRHSLALGESRKMPRLVPATKVPLLAWLRLNTSRPPSPALFCCQCAPPSVDRKTPPYC